MLREVLSAEDFAALTGLGQRRHFAPATEIFREGDAGSFLFCIETGVVEIGRIGRSGRKIVLNHLSRGDLLGEMALLDQGPRSATATALTDVTGVAVRFGDVRAFLLARPEMLLGFTLQLVAKLRSANDISEDITEKDAAVRLARCLLRLAERKPGAPPRVAMALSQSDIGEIIGLSRANVNRYMRAWIRDGLIAVERDVITLCDIAALERIAAR